MKTLLISLLFPVSLNASADCDKPITLNELPARAQQVVAKHFAGQKVALAKMDTGFLDKDYEVIFVNGHSVEFDKDGAWSEVNCPDGAVPSAFIPAAIGKYVRSTFTGTKIVRIERDRNGYEVKLTGGIEVEFNSKFQVKDIDK